MTVLSTTMAGKITCVDCRRNKSLLYVTLLMVSKRKKHRNWYKIRYYNFLIKMFEVVRVLGIIWRLVTV